MAASSHDSDKHRTAGRKHHQPRPCVEYPTLFLRTHYSTQYLTCWVSSRVGWQSLSCTWQKFSATAKPGLQGRNFVQLSEFIPVATRPKRWARAGLRLSNQARARGQRCVRVTLQYRRPLCLHAPILHSTTADCVIGSKRDMVPESSLKLAADPTRCYDTDQSNRNAPLQETSSLPAVHLDATLYCYVVGSLDKCPPA